MEIHIDEAALELPIPVLSVQPLVENAIKHGVALRTESGYVRIRGELLEQELAIFVENSSGGGVAETPGTGVGLQNVRRRLEICYGPRAVLGLTPNPQNTTARLSIPLTRMSASV